MPLSEKKLDKLYKTLGETAVELDSLGPEDLKVVVLGCEQELKRVTDELEALPAFIKAKEVLSDLRSGLSPIKKDMNARIQYALHRLEELGLG